MQVSYYRMHTQRYIHELYIQGDLPSLYSLITQNIKNCLIDEIFTIHSKTVFPYNLVFYIT